MAENREAITSKVIEIAERVGASAGIEIVDVQILGGGAARLLRIYIDRLPGSIHRSSDAIDRPSDAIDRPSDAIDRPSDAIDRPSDAIDRPSGAIDRPSGSASAPSIPTDETAVTAEKPGGVTLADCEFISQNVGTILDVEDVIPGSRYTLEVSSPGVERKLTKPRDFERFVGQKVKIALRKPVENQRTWIGAMTRFAEGMITLEPSPGRIVQFPLDQVEKANLKFEW
jgi:ribosome maturation factor RimP